MSRADDIRARHAAELAMAELEDELVALKARPGDGVRLREVKEALRQARFEQRTAREGSI